MSDLRQQEDGRLAWEGLPPYREEIDAPTPAMAVEIFVGPGESIKRVAPPEGYWVDKTAGRGIFRVSGFGGFFDVWDTNWCDKLPDEDKEFVRKARRAFDKWSKQAEIELTYKPDTEHREMHHN